MNPIGVDPCPARLPTKVRVRRIAIGSFAALSTLRVAAIFRFNGFWRVMRRTAAASVEEMMEPIIIEVMNS